MLWQLILLRSFETFTHCDERREHRMGKYTILLPFFSTEWQMKRLGESIEMELCFVRVECSASVSSTMYFPHHTKTNIDPLHYTLGAPRRNHLWTPTTCDWATTLHRRRLYWFINCWVSYICDEEVGKENGRYYNDAACRQRGNRHLAFYQRCTTVSPAEPILSVLSRAVVGELGFIVFIVSLFSHFCLSLSSFLEFLVFWPLILLFYFEARDFNGRQ